MKATRYGVAFTAFRAGDFTLILGLLFIIVWSISSRSILMRQVFDMVEESIATIPYNRLGHAHFPEGSLLAYGNAKKYLDAVAEFTPQGAKELQQFRQKLGERSRSVIEYPVGGSGAIVDALVRRLWRYLKGRVGEI